MNAVYSSLFASASAQSIIELAGWMLVHTAWQFAMLAVVALMIVQRLGQQSSAVRYNILTSILFGMSIMPVVTWYITAHWRMSEVHQGELVTGENSEHEKHVMEQPSLSKPSDPAFAAIDSRDADLEIKPSETVPIDFQNPSAAYEDRSNRVIGAKRMSRIANKVQPWLSGLVFAWAGGVILFSLRPMVSWWTIRGLLTNGAAPADSATVGVLESLKRRLGVRRRVGVLNSSLIHSPIVVGAMRSIILLPVTLIGNLPPGQLEAILAHELAHVKRYDYLVNMLQTIVETLFFIIQQSGGFRTVSALNESIVAMISSLQPCIIASSMAKRF